MIRVLASKRRVAHAAVALLLLRLRLPRELDRKPLPTVLRALTPQGTRARLSAHDIVEMRRAIAVVEGLCRRSRLVRDTCLFRSVARYAAWRRLGVPVRFVMAVRRDEAQIEGHAWIERDGFPEDGEVVTDYVVTYSFPS